MIFFKSLSFFLDLDFLATHELIVMLFDIHTRLMCYKIPMTTCW
jgi:hypothetical protein